MHVACLADRNVPQSVWTRGKNEPPRRPLASKGRSVTVQLVWVSVGNNALESGRPIETRSPTPRAATVPHAMRFRPFRGPRGSPWSSMPSILTGGIATKGFGCTLRWSEVELEAGGVWLKCGFVLLLEGTTSVRTMDALSYQFRSCQICAIETPRGSQ